MTQKEVWWKQFFFRFLHSSSHVFRDQVLSLVRWPDQHLKGATFVSISEYGRPWRGVTVIYISPNISTDVCFIERRVSMFAGKFQVYRCKMSQRDTHITSANIFPGDAHITGILFHCESGPASLHTTLIKTWMNYSMTHTITITQLTMNLSHDWKPRGCKNWYYVKRTDTIWNSL